MSIQGGYKRFMRFKVRLIIIAIISVISVILATQSSFVFAESGLGLYGAMQKLRQMRLRSGFSPDQVEICLTSYINIVAENWRRLPAIQQKEFDPLFQRPDKPSLFGSVSGLPLRYKTTHFLFHYTVTGPDAVPKEDISPLDGIPDYVEICADAYEKAYHVEVELMRFKKPLDDYILADGGGDLRYDVYLFGGPWLGFTAPDFFIRVRSVAAAAIPYFGINSRIYDFFGKSLGRQYLQTTVAHEFLHSIQFSYNYFMYRWFMEASSTWMESIVYGQGNEIGDTDTLNQVLRDGLLRGWFLHPHTSLDRFDGQHEYGDVIWVYYLVDRFGIDIVKNIYEALADGAFREMGNFWDVFSNHGTNLGAAFKEFAAWNYFTYNSDDGKHYKNGRRFPPVAIFLDNIHQSYPVKKEFNEEEMPEHFASRYIIFEPGSYRGDLAVKVDGADIQVNDNIDLLSAQGIRGWGAKIIVERSDGEIREDEIFTFPKFQEGQMNFQDFGGKIKRIVLILVNMHPDIDEVNHPTSTNIDESQLVGINHKNSISYIAGVPLKGKKLSEPKLHQNIDGSISVDWQLLDINGVKEVAVVRKRFAPSERDQSNSPITADEALRASDMNGDGISDLNLEIIGKVSPTTTSFIDKSILNDVNMTDPNFDASNIRYFYAVVPIDSLSLMGTPSSSEVGISPITLTAPAFFIHTNERALGEWEVQVAASYPLQSPPKLVCVTPNSEIIPIDLQSYKDYNGLFWIGVLSLKSFPIRGAYTFSISGFGKGGEVGSAILSGKKLLYYPPKLPNRMQLSGRIFKPMRDRQLEFYPRGMKIKIFSSSGEFIKELAFDSKWDGTNMRGERVGNGIYFYMAEDGEGKFREVGKVAVRW